MRAAFTARPNYTPFTALPNRTSLTLGLTTPPPCGADVPAPQVTTAAAAPTATIPAEQKPVASQWEAWKAQQHLTGPDAKPDYANPAQMNHLTWYQSHDWKRPYPGESRIYAPSAVPGAAIPAAETD